MAWYLLRRLISRRLHGLLLVRNLSSRILFYWLRTLILFKLIFGLSLGIEQPTNLLVLLDVIEYHRISIIHISLCGYEFKVSVSFVHGVLQKDHNWFLDAERKVHNFQVALSILRLFAHILLSLLRVFFHSFVKFSKCVDVT